MYVLLNLQKLNFDLAFIPVALSYCSKNVQNCRENSAS